MDWNECLSLVVFGFLILVGIALFMLALASPLILITYLILQAI